MYNIDTQNEIHKGKYAAFRHAENIQSRISFT